MYISLRATRELIFRKRKRVGQQIRLFSVALRVFLGYPSEKKIAFRKRHAILLVYVTLYFSVIRSSNSLITKYSLTLVR